MRNHRISDTDAAAIVDGTAPAARPDLADVATALSEFRAAAFESLPQPSAALRERLEIGAEPSSIISTTEETRTRAGGARRVIAALTGLGIVAKIALGSTVALAAVAGVGTAGLLPGGAQDVFNTVVSTVTNEETAPVDEPVEEPAEEPTTDPTEGEPADGPAEGENFGSYVSEEAQNKEGTGREFGDKISDQAKNNGNGNGTGAGDKPETPADSTTDPGSGKPDGSGTGGKKR